MQIYYHSTRRNPWAIYSRWTRRQCNTGTYAGAAFKPVDSISSEEIHNTPIPRENGEAFQIAEADTECAINRVCDGLGFRIAAQDESPVSLTRGSVSSISGDRFYYPEAGAAGLLSVTSVIEASRKKNKGSKLNKWRSRMKQVHGESKYQADRNRTLDNGIRVHKYAEDFLTGRRSHKLTIPESDDLRFAECAASLRPVLARVEKVFAIESDVFSAEKGIAGRFDCIAKIDGKCVLIDWKTSARKKAKPKLRLKDYHETPLQLSAYVTGTRVDAAYSNIDVEGALIVTCFSTGRAVEELWLDQDDILKYAQEFEECVELAYSAMESANDIIDSDDDVDEGEVINAKLKRRSSGTTEDGNEREIELASFAFEGFDLVEEQLSELDCYLYMAKFPGR